MFKGYLSDWPKGTVGAASLICVGFMASSVSAILPEDEITVPVRSVDRLSSSYHLRDGLDTSYSGVRFASLEPSFDDELDSFWAAVEDGSAFNVSAATSQRIDRLLAARPGIADFL